MKRIRHLLLTTLEDTSSPRSWSGIPFSLRRALESRVERLTILDRLPVKRSFAHGALRLALGGSPPRWPLWATDPALKQFGRDLQKAADSEKPDFILSLSSQSLVHYRPGVPVSFFSDAPWLAWKETYLQYEPMPLNGPEFAGKEACVAAKCNAIIFSSQWAVDEGHRIYGIDDDRFHVAPLGATWVPELNADELQLRVKARDRETLRLLFVGRDWERKGGSLTLSIARLLNASGARVRLDIVGCRPVLHGSDAEFVQIHGPLDHWHPEQAGTLRQLFLDSHFLVVPTDAECFGIVFAEASAHALPVISKSVYAVPFIVKDGETGILESRHAEASAYTSRILGIFGDPNRYVKMALAARKRYEQDFTWENCASHVITALESSLESPGVAS